MKSISRWFNEKFLIQLNDNKFLFKLLTTLLVLDFVAFVSLANVNPLQLLNPLQFLGGVAVDKRESVKMTYPLSMIDEQKRGETAVENIEQLSREVNQKVYLAGQNCQNTHRLQNIECNILLLLHELQLGPSRHEVMVKRLLKDKELIKTIWLRNSTLVVDVNATSWSKVEEVDQKLVLHTFEKSISANFPQVKNFLWTFFADIP